ncbi:hypothetical protein CGRA01v4_14917 [Colletotrichum graminicola]|nr:hypothetical protein CGRA01v4_14917 [Colletotrichum graminicola]
MLRDLKRVAALKELSDVGLHFQPTLLCKRPDGSVYTRADAAGTVDKSSLVSDLVSVPVSSEFRLFHRSMSSKSMEFAVARCSS